MTFLFIFVILFLKIYIIKNDCPQEIKNNSFLLNGLNQGEFFRFSQCFFCITYQRRDEVSIYDVKRYLSASQSLFNENRYLCLFNNKVYEFNNINNCTNEFDLSSNLTGYYYNFLINDENYHKLDYFICFVGNDKYIHLFQYSFIYESEENIYINSKIINDSKVENPRSLSCQIFYEYLICFYFVKPYLYAEIFDFNDNFTSINKTQTLCYFENNKNNDISIVTSNVDYYECKILVCLEQKENTTYIFIYNFLQFLYEESPSESPFQNIKKLDECETKNQLMVAYFFNAYFIFICQLKNNNNKYKFFFINSDYPQLDSEEEVETEVEEEIQQDGFLFAFDKYWFYNQSYDESFDNSENFILNDSDSSIPISSSNLNLNSSYLETTLYSSKVFSTIYTYPENSIPISSIININKNEDELLSNITNILKDIEPGQTVKIKEDYYTIIIKPTNSSIEANTTYINFTECESILRGHYNISNSSFITLLQLELFNNNSNSLINQIEYEAYDENFTKLNLSLCKDIKIQIIYSIKDNILNNMEKISSLQNSGIDVFNINDSFFWDVCQPFSDSENDVILEDRIKYLYQNISLCEQGCTYNKINLENMTVLCDCKIKENIVTVLSEINLDQIKYETTSNFDIIKCFNIIFKFKLKKSNIGFWIFTILLIVYIPLLFSYCYFGIKPSYDYVINEMEKNGYINKKTNDEIIINDKKNENNPPKKNVNNKIVNNLIIVSNNSKKIKHNKKKVKKRKLLNKIDLSLINNSKYENSKSVIKEKKFVMPNITTQNVDEGKDHYNKNNIGFKLISINLNKEYKNDFVPKDSNIMLNNYTFEEAIKYDQRSTCLIYFIYLLSKQVIFHTFFYKTPLEPFYLRLLLLFFIFSCDLALNAIFYFNDLISKKYHYAKDLFLFTFNNNLTVILLSTFIGYILLALFIKLCNSTSSMREIFKKEEEKMKKDKKYMISKERKIEIKNEIDKIFRNYKIKIRIFLVIEFSLMIFFWYYVILFCHVYPSTQTSWILNSFLSMLSRFIFDNLICLGLSKLYRIGVDSNVHCIYRFAIFLYGF